MSYVVDMYVLVQVDSMYIFQNIQEWRERVYQAISTTNHCNE